MNKYFRIKFIVLVIIWILSISIALYITGGNTVKIVNLRPTPIIGEWTDEHREIWINRGKIYEL